MITETVEAVEIMWPDESAIAENTWFRIHEIEARIVSLESEKDGLIARLVERGELHPVIMGKCLAERVPLGASTAE